MKRNRERIETCMMIAFTANEKWLSWAGRAIEKSVGVHARKRGRQINKNK